MDNEQTLHIQRTKQGVVVSTKMQKTIVVAVTHFAKHPLYKKAMRRTTRFLVHNILPSIAVGDMVEIAETKPMSRHKHFIVVRKVTV